MYSNSMTALNFSPFLFKGKTEEIQSSRDLRDGEKNDQKRYAYGKKPKWFHSTEYVNWKTTQGGPYTTPHSKKQTVHST